MKQTVRDLCGEYPAIDKALGRLRRLGVLRYVEEDELISVAAMALIERGPMSEALSVTVARRAMIALIRRNEVRQRGRVYASGGHEAEVSGAVISEADQWDAMIYGKQHIQPGHRIDLWEAMGALPAREYRVLVLSFWGGCTQGEIGADLGISQQMVCKILERAKKNLASVVNGESRAITYREREITVTHPQVTKERTDTRVTYQNASCGAARAIRENGRPGIAEASVRHGGAPEALRIGVSRSI